jgi:8-amino-7-oxononanoate synthase
MINRNMTYHFDSIIAANLEGQRSIINQVLQTSPMFDADAIEIKNRMIRFKDHWVVDFASCNYLGYDLELEIIESIEPALKRWGVHPSWCRLVASPSLYSEAEEKLADLIGCEDTLILPTVTLIGIGVIPALMGKDGVMFLDKIAHMTMYEAAKMSRDSGSMLINFQHKDYDFLEHSLKAHKDNPKKLIMVDGTYSMTGNYADIDILASLAHKYNAILYVDDAHGFGVIGESPDANLPYGYRGNGVVKHFAQNYDRILYIGGLSKAYSSLAAFISCDKPMKQFLKAFATPYDLSGPCPTASLQSLITGLAINETKGDGLRKRLYSLTKKTIDGLREKGFFIDNQTYFPIVSVWLGNTDHLIATSNILWKAGILVTLSPYPMVKKGDETLRITITAANTEDEVNQLLRAFDIVKEYLIAQNAPLKPEIL